MAGATAAIRERSMLPSCRRRVRGSRRWAALTSLRERAAAQRVRPGGDARMVFSGSPPEGRAAARAHTGPEVSWSARCACVARSAAVARAAGPVACRQLGAKGVGLGADLVELAAGQHGGHTKPQEGQKQHTTSGEHREADPPAPTPRTACDADPLCSLIVCPFRHASGES